jgi:3-isopropylmalate dehydrogenase
MDVNLVLLPGDGIGPEIVQATKQVLQAIADRNNHKFQMHEYLLGGCAIDAYGTAFPDETKEACLRADAILLGAVGGPKWDDPTASVRPEQGLLGLRQALKLFANLRPVKPHSKLLNSSPLRVERLLDVDILIVRELTGGVYFGKPRERRLLEGELWALDTMIYGESEIRRIAHKAFQLAKNRRGKVSSVDKANVLESSRLWRQTVAQVSTEYPEINLENILVDAAAMYLITQPSRFDVLVTTNLFGDILSDEASVLTGSMGNLPSASIGDQKNRFDLPVGLYEPIHGSAPDIAGKGIANPIGTVLSAAMMLRYSLGLEIEATQLENAVDQVLMNNHRTVDLASPGESSLDTSQMTSKIIDYL